MAVEYKELRAAMFDYLKGRPKGQFDMTGSILRFYESRDITLGEEDFETLQQIIHELYFEEIFILGNSTGGTGAWMLPYYRLTKYGQEVVNTTEYQPHDPEGYLSRIKSEIPNIDKVIVRYLEEGLSCFRRNLLLAAAVMIGCAAEKAMLLLIEEFGIAIADLKKKAQYERETKSRLISRKYKALWKRLQSSSATLPDGLGDDLQVILDRVFDLIRTTRNDAGHPTGKTIERETIRANLILFPGYCRRVYELTEYFSRNQV